MAPAHSHDHYEETIYGIDGVLTWTVDGQADRGRAGTGALHSARRGHRFDNFGTQEAKVLCVITPARSGHSLPRGARGGAGRSRRPARPRQYGGGHAAPRPDARAGAAAARLAGRPLHQWATPPLGRDRLQRPAFRPSSASRPRQSLSKTCRPTPAGDISGNPRSGRRRAASCRGRAAAFARPATAQTSESPDR